jgi:hypothetical protein
MASSLFSNDLYDEPRGMHGAAAVAQVAHSSDLDPNQPGRTLEYYHLAQMLAPVAQAMKSLAAKVDTTARTAGNRFADDSHTGAAMKCLSKAKRLTIKAQSDDPEDRDDGDTDEEIAAEIDRCLARAKKLLLRAHEADENEDGVDEVFKSLLKARVSRAGLVIKASPAAVKAAAVGAKATATDARMKKALSDVDAMAATLQGGLAEVVGLLSQRSGVHVPPHLLKADTGPAIPTNHAIEQMVEAKQLSTSDAIQAKVVRNLLQQGATKEAANRINKTTSEGVRLLFGDFRKP